MTDGGWVAATAAEVQAGDRLRLGTGKELTVTRVKPSFLGVDDLVCFVEDSDERWLAQALWVTTEVEIRR
jgi:hypothetical protein